MASTSAYQAIRLIDPLLLSCVEATELLKRVDNRDETTFSTSRLGQPLYSIEKSLIGTLVLLLNRTDRCRHPFRDTSLEENCFKAIIRGCSNILKTVTYNLGLLEAENTPVAATWQESQNLLEEYDRFLANLLGILSPARTGQSLSEFLEAVNASNQDATRLTRLIDNYRREKEATKLGGAPLQRDPPAETAPTPLQREQPNGAHATPEAPRAQPPSRQSTFTDGAATPTRAHANCSGYKRGLREGRSDTCATLKELDIFENEPPRGKRTTWLLKAIEKGSVKGVELLLNLDVDVNQLSSKVDSKDPVYLPLCYAARRGSITIVDLLIQKGARLDARDSFGNNALLAAASNGQDSMVEHLLDTHKFDIETQRNGTDRKGFTPLMMAIYSGQISTIKILLDRRADRKVMDEAGNPLLHLAAGMGRINTLKLLLENGVQIVELNEKTDDTALHCAVRKGSLDVALYIIENGRLLLNAKNKKKQTPLALAAKTKKPDLVRMLLERGAEAEAIDRSGRMPLHNAVIAKDTEVIKLLVEGGAKIDSLDNDGRSPLYHAVKGEDPNLVAWLLSHGHKMEVENRSGRYPLQYVMEMPKSKETSALLLLREFLKVHEQGEPLHSRFHALPRAARDGKLELVKEMLRSDPKLVDMKPSAASDYQPPLHEAVKMGQTEVIKELCNPRSYILPMNNTDHRGNSALHQAIISNRPALISLLIEKGADKELPSGQDDGLLPPLHLAAREQNLEAIEALLRKNADAKRRISGGTLCDMCMKARRKPTGRNARCVLRNLDPSVRKPNFQRIDDVLLEAFKA